MRHAPVSNSVADARRFSDAGPLNRRIANRLGNAAQKPKRLDRPRLRRHPLRQDHAVARSNRVASACASMHLSSSLFSGDEIPGHAPRRPRSKPETQHLRPARQQKLSAQKFSRGHKSKAQFWAQSDRGWQQSHLTARLVANTSDLFASLALSGGAASYPNGNNSAQEPSTREALLTFPGFRL